VTGHWSASDAQISADLHGQVGVGADQTRRADRVDLRLGSDGAPVGSGPVLQPGDPALEDGRRDFFARPADQPAPHD